jgi:TetR/AcrR family transcriptional regulator, repressor for neighboring sulfatase
MVAEMTESTTELIVERGLTMSVREIASRARVNHGLVHTYFGSKDALLVAAFDEINARAAAERGTSGYPASDIAARRGGELAKAIARVMLEADGDLFSSHPVIGSWREALRRDRADLSAAQVDERVAVAAAAGLGWALFADLLSDVLGFDDAARSSAQARIAELLHDIGGVPLPTVDT